MNMKLTSTTLAALMIAGSTSFSAFAAMPSGTVVIGNTAYDLDYANDPANATAITAAIVAGGAVYVKDFNGNWIDNVTGNTVAASAIPAVTYTNAKGTTNYNTGDVDSTGVATSATVAAVAADTFAVTFNGAVADTSKVTFAVNAAGGTAVTTAVTWNAAKTVATLTKSSKFTSGDYTVAVTNDTVVLPTATVTIAEQKIAKIQITSTKLGVTTDSKTSIQKGYATYKILDQYGVDITNGALANNVQFQTGVGTIDAKKGLITITPTGSLNLMTFNSGVTITANDTNTGVSATATLAVTSQLGTLTNITLTGLTNVDNKVITAGDTTDLFYAGFTATDISGNPTTNYTLMKQGLIFSGNNDDNSLTTSSTNVTAKLVQDPLDSNKGVIEVRATADTLSVDMPLVITAMTWTGSTSQITTTLHKQAEVLSFTLLAPNDSIASGESKEIPFSALDQNGVALTKFSDFPSDLVTFSNLIATRNVDGTLSLKNKPMDNTNGSASVPEVVSAMTKAGKYSNLTLNIQKPTVADTLSLDTTVLNTTMQASAGTSKPATQFADFGWDNGGLKLKDQYGRAIDINASENAATYKNYKVVATSSNTAAITVGSSAAGTGGALADGSSTGVAGVGQNEIAIQSLAAGSSTVSFNVYDISQKNSSGALIFTGANYSDLTAIDTKTQTFTVLADKDIKDYVMDAVTAPMYSIKPIDGSITDAQIATNLTGLYDKYKANPKVYGTTSTGAKVVLRGTPIIGASSSSTDFTVYAGKIGTGNVAYDGVKIIANKFADAAKTGSSAVITVSLLGADNITHSVKTNVTSLKADPFATSIDANVDTYVPGISRIDDTVTITATDNAGFHTLLGTTLSKYNASGKKGHVYFAPVDQYGQTSYPLSQFSVLDPISSPDGTYLQGSDYFKIDANSGLLSYSVQNGDFVTVSGTTSSGLTKTIKICFGASTGTGTGTGTTVTTAQATAALVAINAGTETDSTVFTTAGVTGVVAQNLALYDSAISTAKAYVGSDLTLIQVQKQVDLVNASAATTAVNKAVLSNLQADVTAAQTLVTALPTGTTATTLQGKLDAVQKIIDGGAASVPLGKVNTATDATIVKTQIENAVLGLDLTIYNKLTNAGKTAVATAIYNDTTSTGYTVASLQTELNKVPVIVTQQTADTKVISTFNSTLATNGNTLLGGSVNTASNVITLPIATTAPVGSDIFDKLVALNVTGITLGSSALIPIASDVTTTAAAKTAVEAYFKSGLVNTVVTIAVTDPTTKNTVNVQYTLVLK